MEGPGQSLLKSLSEDIDTMDSTPPTTAGISYIEDLYARYLADPGSVDAEWHGYFAELAQDDGDVVAARRAVDGPSFRPASIFHGAAAAPAGPPVWLQPGAAPAKAIDEDALPKLPSDLLAERVEALRSVKIFHDLPDGEIELAARLTTEKRVAAGDLLFREGSEDTSLYLLIHGVLQVRRRDGLVVTLQAGDVVGELAVFTGEPRVADVVAQDDALLLQMRRQDLLALIEARPVLGRGLLQTLAGRLRQDLSRQDKVNQLINAHRVYGHLMAHLNPLAPPPEPYHQLELEYYGFGEQDLDSVFATTAIPGSQVMKLGQLLEHLRSIYCRSIGVQFMHIDDLAAKRWLLNRIENPENHRRLSRDEQLHILTKLTDAELVEQFIHRKFLGAKRFSLEGAETLIPLLDLTLEDAGRLGVREVVIGMAHRGRLNVLINVLGKRPSEVFREFDDADPDEQIGRGDVKYHLGYSADRKIEGDESMHLSMCFNPSHLEFVDPVAQGRVRAKQDRFDDAKRRRGLCVLIHGDAAFAGQGVIQELFNFSDLEGYSVGGTVHIVVNNQIGFTTPPEKARSTSYATDVARMLQTPIFHVNGEDPEAVAQVVRWAMDYRAEFGQDIVLDMYCYRKHGHNEGDEPAYTQPLLYDTIRKRESVRDGYLEHLLNLDEISRDDAEEIAERRKKDLENELEEARKPGFKKLGASTGEGLWEPYRGGLDAEVEEVETRVDKAELAEVLRATTRFPEGFEPHRKLKSFFDARLEMADGERSLDWAAAEAAALGTLSLAGTPIRFSGQDSTRGTFSHRHTLLHDFETGETYMPLQHLAPEQTRFEIWDSPLSEVGVLGFEYGYSLDTPDGLTLWEAQFGDFCNVAQVIIDQFISSSEDKWRRLSGLVMLLPHGFEGQGPEHSSARLERFLNLCAEDNIQVVNLTTPAQYFHCLRRQVLRPLRKPLIVMSPKSLLRHAEAVSDLDDLAEGSFERILPDRTVDPKKVKKILLTSGKLYYELDKERRDTERGDVAILRLEQLYPIREETVVRALEPYADGTPLVWVQEEPANMGALGMVRLRLKQWVHDRWPFTWVSRPESASPATGSMGAHKKEQRQLIEEAFD